MKDQFLETKDGRTESEYRQEFMEVYNKYASQIYQFALSMTKNPEDAEEITSDVFVCIWQKREMIDHSYSLLAFLKKVTKDLTWNHLKKIARSREQQLDFAGYLNTVENSSTDELIFREYQEIMKTALEQLTPQQRQVFSLRYITGKNLNQIAEEMQISKNTVKVHLAKSKRMILHALPFNTI